MILKKEEFLETLKNKVGDDTSDESIKFLEDMSDTYNALETANTQPPAENEKYNEKAFKELDDNWRKKYKERFFSNEDENIKPPKPPQQQINKPPAETPQEAKITYADLFSQPNGGK